MYGCANGPTIIIEKNIERLMWGKNINKISCHFYVMGKLVR